MKTSQNITHLRIAWFWFAILAFSSIVNAQKVHIDSLPTQPLARISFGFDGIISLSNNEYGEPQAIGYTEVGSWIRPNVAIKLNDKSFFEVGMFYHRYFGADSLIKQSPLFFRGVYAPNSYFSAVLGNIYNNKCHRLPRQLYDPEIMLYDPNEEGIQFLYHKPNKFSLDIWLDWQQYIFENSPVNEVISNGISIEKTIFHNALHDFTIPLALTNRHRGGEIDTFAGFAQNQLNLHGGVKYRRMLNSKFISAVTLASEIFYYTGDKDYGYVGTESGSAVYSTISADVRNLSIKAGYWSGEGFRSALGQPVYFNSAQFGTYNQQQIFDTFLDWRLSSEKNFNLTIFSHWQWNITTGNPYWRAGATMAIGIKKPWYKK